jgi:hypothetical protein
MGDSIDDLRTHFANVAPGKRFSLDGTGFPPESWVLRLDTASVSVAVPALSDIPFDEAFNKIRIHTGQFVQSGESTPMVFLTCLDYAQREPFATVAGHFLAAEHRDLVSTSPEQWWGQWKELLGNAVHAEEPYAVLAELIVLQHLSGLSLPDLDWAGPNSATHDITSACFDVEVKSTVMKSDSTVTISSAHQLHVFDSRPLFLFHVRLERSFQGHSIDSTRDLIVEADGIRPDRLDAQISRAGLPPGRHARTVKYDILSIDIYPVTSDFPRLKNADFKGENPPAGIVVSSYQLDLTHAPQRWTLEDGIRRLAAMVP